MEINKELTYGQELVEINNISDSAEVIEIKAKFATIIDQLYTLKNYSTDTSLISMFDIGIRETLNALNWAKKSIEWKLIKHP